MLIHKNISLKPYNTFHIDVNAQYLAEIKTVENLVEVFSNREFIPLPKLVLGGGSNVLFTGSQRKVIIKMNVQGINIIEQNDDFAWVKVGAGVVWHQFVLWAIENNLGGIENLSLIPGTVGAAPMQNIGAYGVEIKDVFEELEAFDIKSKSLKIFNGPQCNFGYRYSIFKGELKNKFVITSVTFKLNKKPVFNTEYGAINETIEKLGYKKLSIKAISEAIIQIRQSKLPDPAEIGNAGSFFKNPYIEKEHFEALKAAYESIPGFPVDDDRVKVPAAWLIDQSGWKGYRDGNIGVHIRQPLVLVNYGNGAGKDILYLSRDIQKSVQKKFGIDLEREVNVI